MRSGLEPVAPNPGVGFMGIRLTWARRGSANAASSAASRCGVVDPGDHRPLDAEPAVAGAPPVVARRRQVAQRVPAVHGHQLVAQLVAGRVQRHRQRHRERLAGEAADAGDHADGGHGDVAGADADVVVEADDGVPAGVVVGERLAHPHEHDVGHPPALPGGVPGGPHHLLHDLAGGQVALEAHLAGGAEPAPHRAPRLARHAHRGPPAVVHQHGLDHVPVGERPQELDGRVAVARAAGQLGQGRREEVGQHGPQPTGQLGHRVGTDEALVQPLPHLVHPVPRLPVEELGQIGPADAVEGRRRVAHGVAAGR